MCVGPGSKTGHAERFGEADQRRDRARVAPGRARDQDRTLRGGQHAGGAFKIVRRGHGPTRGHARLIGVRHVADRLGEHFARQGQVHRAARLGARDGQGAIDDALQVGAMAQLVVPLDPLANHAALIERLLGPVDAAVARAFGAAFGQGRATRGKEHRDTRARGVDQAAGRVGGAGDGVHHDDLRLAADHGVAVGHGHGGDLVGHGDRASGPAPRSSGAWRRRRRSVRSRCHRCRRSSGFREPPGAPDTARP